jgi:hypothetical protein
MDFSISAIDLRADAASEPWVYDALMWLANHARPAVGAVIQHQLRNIVTKALAEVRREGSCAYASDLLKVNEYIDLQVHAVHPVTSHVPTIGTVELAVNVSKMVLPRSLNCGPWSFNGTVLNMQFTDMQLSSDFQWMYRSRAHNAWGRFWHNAGDGSFNTSLSADIHLDFLRPSHADIKLKMSELDLTLRADAHNWMYRALNSAFRPLIRRGIEAFGGDLIKKEIECLSDSQCYRPGLHAGSAPQNELSESASAFVV